MATHGRGRNAETARDLNRPQAAPEQLKHAQLARSQPGQPGLRLTANRTGQAPSPELRDHADESAGEIAASPRPTPQEQHRAHRARCP